MLFQKDAIDNNLNWQNHTNIISEKLSEIFYVIRQLKPISDDSTIIIIYYGVICRKHTKYLNYKKDH